MEVIKMIDLATTRQKELIRKLANGSLKQIDLNFLESGCTKEAADKWIKELIAEANGDSHKDFKTEKHSMSFMSFVKARMEYYARRNIEVTLSKVIEEVKDAY